MRSSILLGVSRDETRHFVLKVGIGIALLFVMGQVRIPIGPVPMSLQTVAVMALGLLYSRSEALFSVGSYLSLGLVGVPIWSGFAGGTSVLLGASGGYLTGFMLAVWLMTTFRLFFKAEDWRSSFVNCLLGTAVIFVCGVSWLSYLIGLEQALILGFYPFIIPGFFKAMLLVGCLKLVKR